MMSQHRSLSAPNFIILRGSVSARKKGEWPVTWAALTEDAATFPLVSFSAAPWGWDRRVTTPVPEACVYLSVLLPFCPAQRFSSV